MLKKCNKINSLFCNLSAKQKFSVTEKHNSKEKSGRKQRMMGEKRKKQIKNLIETKTYVSLLR